MIHQTLHTPNKEKKKNPNFKLVSNVINVRWESQQTINFIMKTNTNSTQLKSKCQL